MPLVQLLPTRLRLTVLRAMHNAAALRAVWRGPRRVLVRSTGARDHARTPQVAAAPSPPLAERLERPAAAVQGAGAAAPARADEAPGVSASPVDRAPAQGPTFRVRYLRSGAALDVSPTETLLEAALDAGLDLAHACQMGMCGTCKSRLVSGDVEMDEPNTLSDEERARGFCLPCVSHPLGPIDLDA